MGICKSTIRNAKAPRPDYFQATYSAGSLRESDSLVDESLTQIPKDYFHATYFAGSISESDSLIDENLRLMHSACNRSNR